MTLGVVLILALGAAGVWLILPRDTEAASPSGTPEPAPTTQTQRPTPSPTPRPTARTPSPTASAVPEESVVIVGSPALTSPIMRLQELTDVTYTVDPIGQSTGAVQFAEGTAHVVMAQPGLSEEQIARGGAACATPTDTHQFLVNAQMTYLAFNLDDVHDLVLDGPTVAAIYSGDVTTWNDPMIAALNRDVTLPDRAITPIYRADSAPANRTLHRWLAATSEWAPPDSDTEWDRLYGVAADGSWDAVEKLRSTPGAIGYTDLSGTTNLAVADILLQGESLSPEPASLQGHLDAAVLEPTALPDPLTAGAYPLVEFSYLVTCMEYADPGIGESVRTLLETAMSSNGQEFFANTTGVVITHTKELEKASSVR